MSLARILLIQRSALELYSPIDCERNSVGKVLYIYSNYLTVTLPGYILYKLYHYYNLLLIS